MPINFFTHGDANNNDNAAIYTHESVSREIKRYTQRNNARVKLYSERERESTPHSRARSREGEGERVRREGAGEGEGDACRDCDCDFDFDFL